MMKKWLIAILLIGVCFFSIEAPAQAQEKVIWDGAEIVEGQIGKMTFSKDVKVYKKNEDGSFTSMIVKRNNFFRVYGKDQQLYGGKTHLWMSGGYRVLQTELVIYKEVPRDILKMVSGGDFVKGETVYASSKSGLSIKESPNNSAETRVRIPFGTILQVVGLSGDFVKVLYDPYFGPDRNVTGYVSRNYIASLPKPSTKYLSETTEIEKQVGRPPVNASYLLRKTGVNAYFTTADGFTYISTGNITGFVPSNLLSAKKVVDVPLTTMEDPSLIAFDANKEIFYHGAGIGSHGYYLSGRYNVEAENFWRGSIESYSEEGLGSTSMSTFTMAVKNNELVYKSELIEMRIPFPLKVGSKIAVNSKYFTVEKMLERYTDPSIRLIGNTIDNAIIVGPYTIGKNYFHNNDEVWYQ